MIGAELADRALIVKERAEQAAQAEERTTKRGKARASTPDNDHRLVLIPATPPKGPEGDSQGGTTITLALGSPRRPFPPPVPCFEASPLPDPLTDLLPPSTAPARLTTRAGRPCVKTTRAIESKEDGYLPESQPR